LDIGDFTLLRYFSKLKKIKILKHFLNQKKIQIISRGFTEKSFKNMIFWWGVKYIVKQKDIFESTVYCRRFSE